MGPDEDLQALDELLLEVKVVPDNAEYLGEEMLVGVDLHAVLDGSEDDLFDLLWGEGSDLLQSDVDVIGDHVVEEDHGLRGYHHSL